MNDCTNSIFNILEVYVFIINKVAIVHWLILRTTSLIELCSTPHLTSHLFVSHLRSGFPCSSAKSFFSAITVLPPDTQTDCHISPWVRKTGSPLHYHLRRLPKLISSEDTCPKPTVMNLNTAQPLKLESERILLWNIFILFLPHFDQEAGGERRKSVTRPLHWMSQGEDRQAVQSFSDDTA